MATTERSWGHRTRTYRALSHRFRLRSTDAAHGRALERLLDSFPEDDGAAPWYSLVEEDDSGERRWHLTFDGQLVTLHNQPNVVLQALLSHINRASVAATTDRVLVHAAVAARDGKAVVIPGAPDAGKSTLVAALLCAGFEYLSDEVAAIELRTGAIDAYPKPLSLDLRSIELLPALRDPAGREPDLDAFTIRERYLNPRWVDRGAVTERGRLALIVVSHLRVGHPTVAATLPRADALAALHANSFNFGTLDAAGFRELARLVEACSTLQLVGADLPAAVQHIEAALAAHVTC